MNGRRIGLVCAGFVLIFVFTLLFSNFAAAADSNVSIVKCDDSDGGEYLYTAGSCKYADSLGVVYGPTYDTCTENDTYVEEQLCNSSNSCYGRNLPCPNGCKDGACLSVPEIETGEVSVTILDEQWQTNIKAKINVTLYPDSGKIISTQGTETGYSVFYSVPVGTYYVAAEDPNNKYSPATSVMFKVYANTGSAITLAMKAQTTTGCTDSDGGLDYYVKGTIKGMAAVAGMTVSEIYTEETDFCLDGYSLNEYYCDINNTVPSDVWDVIYKCPNGCSNGACLTAEGLPDLSIYKLSAPSSVKVNEKFSIDLGIINKGSAVVSQAFLISAKADSDGVQIYDNKFSLALEPNQSAGTALTGYATNAGTYKITIYADYLNQILESDESNNSYTFALEVSAEEKTIVKLGEDFGLKVGEKAYLESDNIEIQLASVFYPVCKTDQECPKPWAQLTLAQGEIGTSITLGVTGTANVFGVEIKNTGISADNWASFIISKETIPGGVTAKLGESFQLEEYQTAKIFSESNEDLMKITVDDVVVYGDIVCVKAPCEAAEYAQLTVSIASGGVKVIRLGLGGFEYVDKYKVTVQSFWTTVEGKAITSILVEKAERPDMITVSLNSGFNLQLHQTALVKETELKITLEGLDAISGTATVGYGTAAFSVSLPDGKTDYIKLNNQRKGTDVQEIFGHEITLTNVGRDNSVSLIVRKKEAPRTINVDLDEKFSLLVNQTANVYDDRPIAAAEMPTPIMSIALQGLEEILCAAAKTEKGESEKIVRCDSRPVARIMVQSVPSCPETAACVAAFPQYISLRESEERAFGNYSIRLLDIGGGKAVFIVKKGSGEELINVHLDEQFDLQTEQTAYVLEEGLNIKLYNIPPIRCKKAPCQFSAEISVWKYETIEQPLSDIKSAKSAEQKPIGIYTLREGETISLYGVEIKLTKVSGNAAAFIVTKGSEAVINVHTNEPFKLSGQQAANVLEANLRIDILQVDASNSQVEFSVSNYLLSAKDIGKPLEQETYETAITKTEAVAAKVAVTGRAAMQVISLPPMPFETYRLGAGESVDVGEFTIKVLSVGGNSAEFIVTEKNTDLRIKLEIYKGWNLISLPGEIDGESAFDCEVSDWRVFEYNTAENKFEAVTQPSFSRAFWLYNPGKNCSPEGRVRKAFPLETIATIEKGWNFIPVLADMLKKKITDFEGCEFKAAYFYNANSKKWEKALTREINESDLGKGIAVYAESACTLSGEEPPIPPEPEEKTCNAICEAEGYAKGTCNTYPVIPDMQICEANEISIGETDDCRNEKDIVGSGKSCCCSKGDEK